MQTRHGQDGRKKGWLFLLSLCAFEVLVSLLLLVTMVAVLRRAAGRMFGISMLMTGKEPSWREVVHWMRQA